MEINFEKLIYPLSFEEFKKNYYEKKALKINNHFYENIKFDRDELNSLLNSRKIPFYKIKLLSGNNIVSPNNHTDIINHCNKNGDIRIHDINIHDENIGNIIYQIINQLKCNLKTDICISYKRAKIDSFYQAKENTFIIVLQGKQQWQIANRSDNKELSLYFDENLNVGQILYIPADNYYNVENKENSIYLLIELSYPTGKDFMEWFINNIIIKDEKFQKEFPIIFSDENISDLPEKWDTVFKQLNQAFISKLKDKDVALQYYNHLIKTQNGPDKYTFPYPFMDAPLTEIQNINFFRPHFQDNVIEINDSSVTVFFWNRKIIFEKNLLPLIEFIFQNTEFKGNTIIETFKEINLPEILFTINTLIKYGIISFEGSV